jgi:multiple sugar transport system substrate-binding protein
MTWQSRRAVDPLVASLPAFRAAHPGIDIEWTARSLAGFEFEPVEQLARRYDLIILDHPFMGDAARKGYLLNLDEGVTGKASDYVGPSLATYHFDGHTYAVPVDAACQVAVFRPDLMQRLDRPPPRTWKDVLDLGQMAERQGLRLAIGLTGVHSLMTFFTLMAGLGQPCATTPDEPLCDGSAAREALSMMRALLSFCTPQVLDWNSIMLHETMVAEDLFAYCPAVYCYATYAEADQRMPLRFADLPGAAGPSPKGSTIGGTGLAISAHCSSPDAARAYARFAASPQAQLDFARHHGQPAHIEAFTDVAIDLTFGGCFSATRASLEGSWIRPRYAGYLSFQEQGGRLIESHLRGDLDETALLEKLRAAFAASGAPA